MRSWVQRAYKSNVNKRALVLLNTPCQSEFVKLVWDHSSVRICADGAANRLYENLPGFIPNVVVGDFDSIKPDVLKYFSNQPGCDTVNQSEDQDSTDLDKALRVASELGCTDVAIVGQFCGRGRMDHSFGIVQSLFKCSSPIKLFESAVVISDDALLQLLLPQNDPPHHLSKSTKHGSSSSVSNNKNSNNQMKTHHLKAVVGSHCGLIPITGKCNHVTTQGLKYNVVNAALEFGQLISTSNTAVSEDVYVTTDKPLLWMMTVDDSDS
jgi:thiamine pyrophosphokinase